MSGESKASENRITAAERRVEALALRKAGLGYTAIAAQLGYAGPSGAYKAIATALGELTREPARELVNLEVARLDDLLLGLWGDARKGNVAKVDRVLKIMQRRADLLGLDAPQRFADVTDTRQDAERIAAEIGKAGDPVIVAQIERDLRGDVLLSQGVRR
jgi:hypothetical protein